MLRFVLRRVGLMGFTMFLVSIGIFASTELLPADAVDVFLGRGATEENSALLREELGLDRSAPVRYFEWISGAVRGDFGRSLYNRTEITPLIGRRLVHSAILAVFAFFVAVPTALIAGIWAGIRPDSRSDRVLSLVGLVGISLPEFVTGVLLILLFSSWLAILPSVSIILPNTTPLDRPQILIMPSLTITAVLFAYIMRMTRANVIEVMQTDYVRTAVLKGLSTREVIFRHVLPNAMLPTITVITLNFGYMLGGLIIVENVFAYPGIGQLMIWSINTRDVPLLEAVALILALTYAVSNLIADLSYAALDPRVRLE